MSESNMRVSLIESLIKILDIIASHNPFSKKYRSSISEEPVDELDYRISELTSQIHDLQDLTKLLAMNQTQLAADMYLIYSQIKDASKSDEYSVKSNDDPPIKSTNLSRKKPGDRRGSGSGGMTN